MAFVKAKTIKAIVADQSVMFDFTKITL
ncbi:hypothetical protein MED121_06165 [Marinomonas sp. MED121]|nr:hypothetical protein MED121_06165 [Marinomonas sp. MED121]